MRRSLNKKEVMKIPNFDLTESSPELRDEQKRYSDLTARERQISAKVGELRRIKANGLSQEDKDSRIAFVLAGQDLPASADVDAELASAMINLRALEDAKEVQLRRIEQAKKVAGMKLTASLKPAHDKLMTRLCAALTDVHGAWAQLFSTKRGLVNNGIGLYGLFSVEPDQFLDVPTDRTTHMADFFRDAARKGYCSIPKEYR
jgi:hypothetical protein